MIRPTICGTWTGVLFHKAYAELPCPACVIADREHVTRKAETHRDLPLAEHIGRCRCGAWRNLGRDCTVCLALEVGAA